MARLLLVLLLAGPATAGPFLRWIDRFGNPNVVQLSEVLAESAREVRVKTARGPEMTVPVTRILFLQRERDDRADERALLDARVDVLEGLRLPGARAILDRIAAKGEKAWLKEYAAAARAVLAERLREKDAAARATRFLEEYPQSRFFAHVRLSVAAVRARAHDPIDGTSKAMADFTRAYKDIEDRGGPMVLRFEAFLLAARYGVASKGMGLGGLARHLGDAISNAARVEKDDLAVRVVAESTAFWLELVLSRSDARGQIERGEKPFAIRDHIRRIVREAELYLPDVRCDLLRELAFLQGACGEPEAAKKSLKAALELAGQVPGSRRGERVREDLSRLK